MIASEPFAVRAGLAALLNSSHIRAMGPESQGAAEIVLAEVLNNIVEHGYAEREGKITITLQPGPHGLLVTVEDRGRAFPREELPEGLLPTISAERELPEGGFGWFLIRAMVRDLSYRRIRSENRVSFCLPHKGQ